MDYKKTTTARRCSIVILSTTVTIILLIIAAGLCVHFLMTDGFLSKVILLSLIGLLLLIGGLAFAFLECLRRSEARKGVEVVHRKYNPAAPPMSGTTSWSYAEWKYSKGDTIRAQ